MYQAERGLFAAVPYALSACTSVLLSPHHPPPPYSPHRCGAGTGLGRGACLCVVTVPFNVLSTGIQRGSHACAWSTGGASARALSGTPAVHYL